MDKITKSEAERLCEKQGYSLDTLAKMVEIMPNPRSYTFTVEQERQYALASGVSDWVLWHQNTIIGEIYKTSSYAGDWAYCSVDGNIKGNAHFKGDAVRELWEMWRVQNNKEIKNAE